MNVRKNTQLAHPTNLTRICALSQFCHVASRVPLQTSEAYKFAFVSALTMHAQTKVGEPIRLKVSTDCILIQKCLYRLYLNPRQIDYVKTKTRTGFREREQGGHRSQGELEKHKS